MDDLKAKLSDSKADHRQEATHLKSEMNRLKKSASVLESELNKSKIRFETIVSSSGGV